MHWKRVILSSFIISILIFISSTLVLRDPVLGSNSDIIQVTVAIGVCGNGAIEAYEECDGISMGGNSCKARGFDGGQVFCDISCSLDTSECFYIDNETEEGSQNQEQGRGEELTVDRQISPLKNIIQASRMPEKLILYDNDKNGKISVGEMVEAFNDWVRGWRKQEADKCDVNVDDHCDLIDMSIILYWVNR